MESNFRMFTKVCILLRNEIEVWLFNLKWENPWESRREKEKGNIQQQQQISLWIQKSNLLKENISTQVRNAISASSIQGCLVHCAWYTTGRTLGISDWSSLIGRSKMSQSGHWERKPEIRMARSLESRSPDGQKSEVQKFKGQMSKIQKYVRPEGQKSRWPDGQISRWLWVKKMV